jgi:hypothetical protein
MSLLWASGSVDDDDRQPISRGPLESAITEAVKKAESCCEAFLGVIVERRTPISRLDANWVVKGIRFGRADRDKSSKALARIVKRMQHEFNLSETG